MLSEEITTINIIHRHIALAQKNLFGIANKLIDRALMVRMNTRLHLKKLIAGYLGE